MTNHVFDQRRLAGERLTTLFARVRCLAGVGPNVDEEETKPTEGFVAVLALVTRPLVGHAGVGLEVIPEAVHSAEALGANLAGDDGLGQVHARSLLPLSPPPSLDLVLDLLQFEMFHGLPLVRPLLAAVRADVFAHALVKVHERMRVQMEEKSVERREPLPAWNAVVWVFADLLEVKVDRCVLQVIKDDLKTAARGPFQDGERLPVGFNRVLAHCAVLVLLDRC